MSSVQQKLLRSAKAVLARTQIGGFLAWWKEELLLCLPKAMRERVSSQPASLVFSQAQDGAWHAARVRAGKVEAERSLDLADPAAIRRHLGYLHSMDDRAAERAVLALGAHQVLRKRFVLPLAAEDNLTQVLSFEMDRQTPFKVDQVYFDARILKRDAAQNQITVELTVTPKVNLDTALAALVPADVALNAVDAQTQRSYQPQSLVGCNLLPDSKRALSQDPQARMRWILAGTMAVFIGMAMKQSLQARQNALDALQLRSNEMQVKAIETAQLAKKLREEIEGANFLAVRKEKRAEATKIMLELTQLIPENTFLERVSFVGENVQIQGESASADKLIAILQKATLVGNPQFQGVIQPNQATGKERFSMQLSIREEAEVPPDAEKAPPPDTAQSALGASAKTSATGLKG
jgi:general secretion pathway protein L